MRSPGGLDRLDFQRDVPTTAADIAALDRARDYNYMPSETYLAWLTRMSATNPPTREIPEHHEPFEL
jgi:hypothetical protein